MKVLVACEESQRVCLAFRRKGHEAYSCDLQECSGGYPEFHLLGDVRDYLYHDWDLIIAHPPCTRLCLSGQRWLHTSDESYNSQKRAEQLAAIEFFLLFTDLSCPKVAIENPVGIMSRIYRKPDCIYNPYDFLGEFQAKRTCLWLKGLPPLIPTQNLSNNLIRHDIYLGGGYSWNSPDCARFRSVTPLGVARAMAEQWG